MKRCLLICIAATLLSAAHVPSASADFGFDELDVTFTEEDGGLAQEAGSHPFAFTTTLGFQTKPDADLGFEVPDGSAKDLVITYLPGLAANPTAAPRCTTLEFLDENCPVASQVGVTDVTFSDPDTTGRFAVFNLTPPPGVAAKLGFFVESFVPVTVDGGVNPNPPYNIVATLESISQALPFYSATTTLWGNPADPAHNPDREGCVGECAAGLSTVPFITVPRACEGPLLNLFESRPWEDPDTLVTGEVQTPGFANCTKPGFAVDGFSARATSKAAAAPSGLDLDLEIDNEGILNPDGIADSDIKKVVVTLPEGMTANPSLAEGLAACSPTQYEEEAIDSEPDQGCPEASKVGTLETETPLLEGEILKGELFIASQSDNPFNSLLALYAVVKNRELGILVKLAGKVEPDAETGQLTTIFGEPGHELPQFPLSRVHVHLREGGRSPLITPNGCGDFETEALFTPWANPAKPLSATSSFEITEGVNGGKCPSGGTPPFEPGFEAGALSNSAGDHSPFLMRLTRRDGDQDLTRFDAALPPGVTAKLAGVERCSDAAIALAKAKSGREELANPSCPANSRIGGVQGGAGVGAQLTYVPGSIYLAGPLGEAPLSVVGIVPAVAGPFDVGTIVVRQALVLDPVTAEVKVDGALSDPIPHILQGIPLRVRDIRVNVDRPDFTLNPTSCDPMTIGADIWGGGSNLFSAIDDAPVARTQRFQASDCASLGFSPRLGLRLKGGAKRGDHPALRAVYRPRPGDSNLSRLSLLFPSSAFVENANFRTICTRVQFAADSCPKGAVYGQVTAFSPLLDEPLRGPAFLRSSNNLLPDLIFDLHGLVDVEVAIRVDSVDGRLRATVANSPDVPVSKVVVQMQGGRKGLFVNSSNICRGKNRGKAQAAAHNGRRKTLRPAFRPSSCKKQRG
jgi:hypothetical protein